MAQYMYSNVHCNDYNTTKPTTKPYKTKLCVCAQTSLRTCTCTCSSQRYCYYIHVHVHVHIHIHYALCSYLGLYIHLYIESPPPPVPIPPPTPTLTLTHQVINCGDSDYLKSKLPDIIPGLIRGYCHSESSVRKVSVFCLVAVQASVGDIIREYLTKLSSSQVSQCTETYSLNYAFT